MSETLLQELRRYVGFDEEDEQALRDLAPLAAPRFAAITEVFYDRISQHEGARKALEGGESQVGHLKVKLTAWLQTLLSGPWDERYYEARARIGRVHVRIALPQHYMFGAMNVLRAELNEMVDLQYFTQPDSLRRARRALGKVLDLDLAIMLHTYREDLLIQQARNERLSTFGQLVGSIGHELRNPLGVIESSLFILKSRIDNDARTQKHVGRIEDQLGIANQIITDLLDMIRDRPLKTEPIHLGEVIARAVNDIATPTGVQILVKGLGDLPALLGDPGQLRQVFVNLLENAVHACGPTGTIRVTGSHPPGELQICVEDSGLGVDPVTRRRLFEPLVTTKEKGVGLGLALVRRIVERHGGRIAYDPAPGKGARFVIHLPAASEGSDA